MRFIHKACQRQTNWLQSESVCCFIRIEIFLKLISIVGYNIPTSYQKSSSSEFQSLLRSRDGLSEEIALDFAEQLMIFEKCGNVYANDEFVQAAEVRT